MQGSQLLLSGGQLRGQLFIGAVFRLQCVEIDLQRLEVGLQFLMAGGFGFELFQAAFEVEPGSLGFQQSFMSGVELLFELGRSGFHILLIDGEFGDLPFQQTDLGGELALGGVGGGDGVVILLFALCQPFFEAVAAVGPGLDIAFQPGNAFALVLQLDRGEFRAAFFTFERFKQFSFFRLQPGAGGFEPLQQVADLHQFELEVTLFILQLGILLLTGGGGSLQLGEAFAQLAVFIQQLGVERYGVAAVFQGVLKLAAQVLQVVLLTADLGLLFLELEIRLIEAVLQCAALSGGVGLKTAQLSQLPLQPRRIGFPLFRGSFRLASGAVEFDGVLIEFLEPGFGDFQALGGQLRIQFFLDQLVAQLGQALVRFKGLALQVLIALFKQGVLLLHHTLFAQQIGDLFLRGLVAGEPAAEIVVFDDDFTELLLVLFQFPAQALLLGKVGARGSRGRRRSQFTVADEALDRGDLAVAVGDPPGDDLLIPVRTVLLELFVQPFGLFKGVERFQVIAFVAELLSFLVQGIPVFPGIPRREVGGGERKRTGERRRKQPESFHRLNSSNLCR